MTFKDIVAEELAGGTEYLAELEKRISELGSVAQQNPALAPTLGKQAASANISLQNLKNWLAVQEKQKQDTETANKIKAEQDLKEKAKAQAITNAKPGLNKTVTAPQTTTPQTTTPTQIKNT